MYPCVVFDSLHGGWIHSIILSIDDFTPKVIVIIIHFLPSDNCCALKL